MINQFKSTSLFLLVFIGLCLNLAAAPFVSDESIWGEDGGQQTLKCDAYTDCFPKKFDATGVCPMQCVLTTEGRGLPNAVTTSFAGKSPSKAAKPKFIISFGPAGSGKSGVANVLTKERSTDFPDLANTTVEVDVDGIFQKGDLAAKFNEYRDRVKSGAGPNAAKFLQRLVAYFRWTADQIADLILNRAFAAKNNVTWETTGARYGWTQSEINRTKGYGYDAVLVYPIVKAEELIRRAKLREQQTGQIAAPDETIREMVKNAQASLIELLPDNPGLTRKACESWITNLKQPDGCRTNRVILIDNTGTPDQAKIAFDTMGTDQTCADFKQLAGKFEFDKKLLEALKAFYAKNSPCQEIK